MNQIQRTLARSQVEAASPKAQHGTSTPTSKLSAPGAPTSIPPLPSLGYTPASSTPLSRAASRPSGSGPNPLGSGTKEGTKEEKPKHPPSSLELMTYSEQQAALTLISRIATPSGTGISRWLKACALVLLWRGEAQSFLDRRHARIRDRLST